MFIPNSNTKLYRYIDIYVLVFDNFIKKKLNTNDSKCHDEITIEVNN